MKQIRLTEAAVERLNENKTRRPVSRGECFSIEELSFEISERYPHRAVEAASQTDYLFIRIKRDEFEVVPEWEDPEQ